MKSTLRRRVTSVERALLEWLDSERPRSDQPISYRSFSSRVEQRQRITGQTYEEAVQALAVHLGDDELDTLISRLQAMIANGEPDTDDLITGSTA